MGSAELTTRRYGRSLDRREETGSTNDDARVAAAKGAPDGHVVCAERQSAGRGARGRTWESPPGDDLYLSIVARVDLPPAALPPLTLAVGLGVAATVEHFVAQPVEIKWPNDVHLGGLKCAGILVETATLGEQLSAAILGIGLDVNRSAFTEALAPIATSMALAAGRRFERAEVFCHLLAEVEREVDRFVDEGPSALAQRVESRLAWRGEAVDCGGARGTLVGLDSEGALRIRQDGTEQIVRSGTLRRADE